MTEDQFLQGLRDKGFSDEEVREYMGWAKKYLPQLNGSLPEDIDGEEESSGMLGDRPSEALRDSQGQIIRFQRAERHPKAPEAKFDRDYIPKDPAARRTREYLLRHYDNGLGRHEHAEALLMQEITHQRDELLRFLFGDIGEDNYLVRWAAEAHLGDVDAIEAWQEIAVSAVQNLREDGILARMHKALERVAQVLKCKSPIDRARLTASLFALKFRERIGFFPTKEAVLKFLDDQKVQYPEAKNVHRLWAGPILGRLRNGRAGPRKKKRNL
jgi:hypothetical protein